MIDPWDVESPEDFLYYCCPECDAKFQGQKDFKNHALEHHQRAQSLFFEDLDVARAAAKKLITIQQNSSSPSTGTSALLEALSSKEASQEENSKETPSAKDTNNTSEDANNKNNNSTVTPAGSTGNFTNFFFTIFIGILF